MATVELKRVFLRVPRDAEHEEPEALQRAALALGQTASWESFDRSIVLGIETLGQTASWEKVLQSRVVVILGERGTGKSTELEALHKQLRANDVCSFFVSLDTLASDRLGACFDHSASELFDRWKDRKDEPAYFLLDSLDEAKLRSQTQTLKTALTKLDRAVGGMKEPTVHVVITSRASDWAPTSDREVLEARLLEGEELGLFQLGPLSDAQVRTLAANEGVTNLDEFGAAIAAASAQLFAERPLDAIWLASYWRKHGQLGALRELVEHNVVEKLSEDPERRSTLESAKAREGLETLAAVATICAVRSVLVPENGSRPTKSPSAIDPRRALQGWSDQDIQQLLARPVFDESTYGRVRIHHRMVQDYLAATWLHRHVKAGLPRKRLYELLFCKSSGKPIVRPHLVATVGWLCLWDYDLQTRIVRDAPEILIVEGDSDGLNGDVRSKALEAYALRFEDRARLFHTFDRASLKRFAGEQLTDTINELLGGTGRSDELLSTLLNIAKEGKLHGCAGRVRELALSDETSPSLRYEAIFAISAIGSDNDTEALKTWVAEQGSFEAEICAAILRCLFPDAIGLDELASVLERVVPSPVNRVDSLDYFLRYKLIDRTPQDMQDSLIERILKLVAKEKDGNVELIPERKWLLKALGVFVRSILEQQGVDDDRSEMLGRALDVFRICNKRGMSARYGVKEVKEALRASEDFRRLLFWRTADQRRATGKNCTRYYDIIDGYGLYGLSEDDVSWLGHDARQRPRVQDRLLAFDTLAATTPRRKGEESEYLDTLRSVAEGDEALTKRLKRMMNPPMVPPHVYRRYDLLYQARQNRKERVRENNRKEIEKSTDRIYGEVDHDTISWSRLKMDGMRERYGNDVVAAFRTGLKATWRALEPVLPHEREHRNSIPESVILGLVGATLDFDDGLIVSELAVEEAKKLVRYAACDLNDFAPWLEAIAEERSSIVAEALSEAIAADFGLPDEEMFGNKVLAKLPGAKPFIRTCCLPVVLKLLIRADPPQQRALLYSLETVLSCEPSKRAPLETVFEARCRAHVAAPKLFAAWWISWLVHDSASALALLEEIGAELSDEAFDKLVVDVCHRVHEWSKSFSVVSLDVLSNAAVLSRLIPIVLGSVRDTDDLEHEGGFSSERRDHAQTVRGCLVSRLMSLEGDESVHVLREIAEDPRASGCRDWFLAQADQRSAMNKLCAPLAIPTAIDWSMRIPGPVKTDQELFDVAINRLDDIRMFVEQYDHSYRAVYTDWDKKVREKHVQVLLTNELLRRSSQQYTVSREEEADRKKKPDIRIFNPACEKRPVSVEIKVAEKWSFNQLVKALTDQLVGKYLRPNYSRRGILVLCAMGLPKEWQDEETPRKLLNFPQLLKRLDGMAKELCAKNDDVDSLRVVGIDFHCSGRRSGRR